MIKYTRIQDALLVGCAMVGSPCAAFCQGRFAPENVVRTVVRRTLASA